jgi:DNA-directed RNA polymerase subunit RPC12/RpoP
MHISVVARSSVLPHMMPITCDRCEATALLVTAQLDMGPCELTETRSYRCESCGHTITRKDR